MTLSEKLLYIVAQSIAATFCFASIAFVAASTMFACYSVIIAFSH